MAELGFQHHSSASQELRDTREAPRQCNAGVENYLKEVRERGDANTTEGLKVTLSAGVQLSNIPPSIVKRLKDLAIQTELHEAVVAKANLESTKAKLAKAKQEGKMKLAGELAAEVLVLEETYLREQQEADNAIKQIRSMGV